MNNNSIFNYFTIKDSQNSHNSNKDENTQKPTPKFASQPPEILKSKKRIQTSKKQNDSKINSSNKKFQKFEEEKPRVQKLTKLSKLKDIKLENKNKTEKKKNSIQSQQYKTPNPKKISLSNNTLQTSNNSYKKLNLFSNKKNNKQEFTHSTPKWALRENVKDNEKRKPDHPDYDPTTLYIPAEAFKKMTPAKRQYWNCKRKNFDKVIFFKLGKFYELFYEDAVLGVKYLDLNFMGRRQHAGFPEQALDKFLKKFVDLGFKVAIVEQVETEHEYKERVKKDKPDKYNRILKRDLISIHTKGTYVNLKHIDEDHNLYFLWSLFYFDNKLSVILFNFDTNRLFYEILRTEHWDYISKFKLLATKFQPSEIIYEKDNLPEAIIMIMNNFPDNPLKTEIKKKEIKYNMENLIQKLKKVDQNFTEQLKMIIMEFKNDIKELKIYNFNLFFDYLQSLMLLEKSLFYTKIDPVSSKMKKENMQIDAQALDHLQIFETGEMDSKNSLYWLINKCSSNFGKRKLKTWLENPLYNKSGILLRQEAIEDLENNRDLREKFQKKLKKVRDLKKMCFYLFKFSLRNHRKVIFFGDISTKRINELQNFFLQLKNGKSALEIFEKNLDDLKSQKIRNLIKEIPDIYPIINSIQECIIWEDEIPKPKRGYNVEFDECNDKINLIKKDLHEYLKMVRNHYNTSEINFGKGKYRYEIEIPTKLVNKKGKMKDFKYSSKKAKFERFITDYIEEKIKKIEIQEEKIKDHLYSFLSFIFKKFSEHKKVWNKIINILSEIDVLCALSEFSHQEYQTLTKPLIVEGTNILEAENLKHPILTCLNGEFVGNNIIMDQKRNFFILTGPNMGGKSTFMRTVCLNIILAQLGCFVFADNFKWSLVDRIFTRVGASDKLEEKKSTFFVEMEETLMILKNATVHSLAIIDELGRGTSTFDGYAIASAVLKYICKRIKCNTIFATHYFFMKNHLEDLKDQLVYNKMDYLLIEEETDKIVFLYKLVEGICEKSFAFNVARIAGINEKIIEDAQAITAEYRKILHI